MAILNNVYTSNTDLAGEVYSTEEIRIGTWIDGKPLYKKTFVGVTSSSGAFPQIAVGGVQNWVSGEGWVVRNDKYQYPIPAFYSPDDFIGFVVDTDGIHAFFNVGSLLSSVIRNAAFNMTFKYTKIND